jgi:hypothetical protein
MVGRVATESQILSIPPWAEPPGAKIELLCAQRQRAARAGIYGLGLPVDRTANRRVYV